MWALFWSFTGLEFETARSFPGLAVFYLPHFKPPHCTAAPVRSRGLFAQPCAPRAHPESSRRLRHGETGQEHHRALGGLSDRAMARCRRRKTIAAKPTRSIADRSAQRAVRVAVARLVDRIC